MERSPKVSVIIPVYNVEKYLAECLESVVNQTMRDIEMICVDDGSTDGSLKILMEYAEKDSRIKVVCKNNGGLSSARNAGLDCATGEYIYFIDSDDKADLHLLEEMTEEADKKNLDIVLFESESFFENKQMEEQFYWMGKDDRRQREYKYVSSGRQMFADMQAHGDYRSPVWKCLYKQKFLRETGLRFYDGIVHEDILFSFAAMMMANAVWHVNKSYYMRRIRPNSIMTTHKAHKNFKGFFICYREMMLILARNNLAGEIAEQAEAFVNMVGKSAFDIYMRLPKEEKKGIDWTDDSFTHILFDTYPWEAIEFRCEVERAKATHTGKVLVSIYKCRCYLKKHGMMRTVLRIAQELKVVLWQRMNLSNEHRKS